MLICLESLRMDTKILVGDAYLGVTISQGREAGLEGNFTIIRRKRLLAKRNIKVERTEGKEFKQWFLCRGQRGERYANYRYTETEPAQ